MDNVLTGRIRRLIREARRPGKPNLLVAVMRVHRVQTWFQRHHGWAMFQLPCGICEKERIHTIWEDGKYHCIACMYAQISHGRPGTMPMRVDDAVMGAFTSAWLAYAQRIRGMWGGWPPPGGSAIQRVSCFVPGVLETSLVPSMRNIPHAPVPICEVGACEACEGYRPYMRREDGDAGCVYCLMEGRIVELEIVDEEAAAVA